MGRSVRTTRLMRTAQGSHLIPARPQTLRVVPITDHIAIAIDTRAKAASRSCGRIEGRVPPSLLMTGTGVRRTVPLDGS